MSRCDEEVKMCCSVKDEGGAFHPLSLKKKANPQMDEKETRGGGMPLAYIHAFAYFFFSERKMQFSPRGHVGD